MARVLFTVIIWVLTCLFSNTLILAQISFEKGSIQWETIHMYDPISKSDIQVLFFEQGKLKENFPVAYVEEKIPLNGQNVNSAYLLNGVYETITEADARALVNTNIPDSINIKTKILEDNKQNYLLYSFLPVRKNKNSGRYERLVNYVVGFNVSKSKSFIQSAQAKTYASSSVLSTGDWYKIEVNKSGIYQISYNDLVDLGLQNPELVKIYGNGGKMLPEKYDGTETDDLGEIPIYMIKGTDGIFNSGDYILFYAQGPVIWKWNSSLFEYNYSKHLFTDEINYFITSGANGKRIELNDFSGLTPNRQVTSYDHFDVKENNLKNLLRSGREFYGDEFSSGNKENSFTFDIPNLTSGEKVFLQSEVLSRSAVITDYTFYYNNTSLLYTELTATNTFNNLAQYAATKTVIASFPAIAGKVNITIKYNNNNDLNANGWLNYLKIWTRQDLKMSGLSKLQLEFCDIRSVSNGNISNFTIDNASNQMMVWDITDFFNVKQCNTNFSNNKLSFVAPSDILHNYIVFDYKSGLLRPTIENTKIANQNLHSLKDIDLVILTHPKFLQQANELAEIHKNEDNMQVIVVTNDQVYNEFSSGNPDVASIRNFMKMLYDKALSPSKRPKSLLLFGDGSYDRKSSVPDNPNYVLTYQSLNSLVPTESYVSDDYFGILDNNEPIEGGLLDIGVGRFPVQDTTKAIYIIDKVKRYYSSRNKGDWRNMLCFLADDGDTNIHMEQADQLARYVAQNYPNFNQDKLYLDAYTQVSSSAGQRCPDIETALYNRLNQGALIINYTGHGNESGLTGELIVKQQTIENDWNNYYLPLFITATCEFSRFDDKASQTGGGESILLKENGGGIALLSTTRLVYSGPNFVLNYQFYRNVFTRDSLGQAITLGEVMRKTKNGSGYDINKLNFTLLGDPALRLPYPINEVATDSINSKAIVTVDTLRAFQKVKISGSIKDVTGNILNSFNGTVYPVIYDKPKKVNTLSNEGDPIMTFTQQKDILYKGQATVKNGYFNFSFILPKDLDYNYDFGKISYYAKDSISDAAGNFKNIVIGGLKTSDITDNKGPEINLYLNDSTFVSGGLSNDYPKLLAKINDLSGINIGGNGIGHDLVAILDNETKNQFILNNYYQTNIDNFQSGEVTYQLPQINPGMHTLTLKAWDIFNNSSVAEINFKVIDGTTPAIEKVKCYPNPLNKSTSNLTFTFEHNINNEQLDVTIWIYDMAGMLVSKLYSNIQPAGYTSGPIVWDNSSASGSLPSKGMYLYRITINTKNGEVQSDAKKLIIVE
jgi:hypothetical protein